MAKAMKSGSAELGVTPPNFAEAMFVIEGTSPYVQNKFPAKAKEDMKRKQEAGSQAKKGAKREKKDFQERYKESLHQSKDGWYGIPAPSFRSAMISACRLVGFTMTRAKLAVFAESDGIDKDDASPLVKITKGKPRYVESYVRLANGSCDLAARGLWDPGWQAKVRVKFDQDQFSLEDIANLMSRVGQQVGIGAGRHDSKTSNGLGWGCFKVIND